MLIGFLGHLRRAGVPVSLRELLDLHHALEKDLIFADINDFYALARTIMVKDESHYDRYDRAFQAFFKDVTDFDDLLETLIPDDWLRQTFLRNLSQEERDKIHSLGGLEKLIEAFKKRLEEQQKRHAGGNRWIGTGGTSPFGHGGYHPEGIRVGGKSEQKRAVKVWEKRQYQNLDAQRQLGTRNIKIALRRLRRFARTGQADQLDLAQTIKGTAENAGLLDVHMMAERHNAVKVLLLLDIGGSMDAHVKVVEELFSAAHTEFKHLEFYYFHNCPYESLWCDNLRRQHSSIDTLEVLRTYPKDYRVIFVGDASMSPYEIAASGGSVEHWNTEAGSVWINRFTEHFDKVAWLNPEAEGYWPHTQSIGMINQLVDGHMYPMTLEGLDAAMRSLT